MITKSDWRAANQALMVEDARRLEPPSAEEMLAYTRGELDAEQEASLQARLVCHPELVRTLTEPFPTEGAEPGDADYLSDEQFAAHWAAMQKRMGGGRQVAGGRLLQFRRWSPGIAAIAATVAVALGVMLWQEKSRNAQPQVLADQIMLPDGRRGPTDTLVVPARGGNVVLIAWLANHGQYENHQIEIVDVGDKTTAWRADVEINDDNDYLTVAIPREFLDPGKYRMTVYGRRGASRQMIETYTFDVTPR